MCACGTHALCYQKCICAHKAHSGLTFATRFAPPTSVPTSPTSATRAEARSSSSFSKASTHVVTSPSKASAACCASERRPVVATVPHRAAKCYSVLQLHAGHGGHAMDTVRDGMRRSQQRCQRISTRARTQERPCGARRRMAVSHAALHAYQRERERRTAALVQR